ncbi:LamG domain-containing protein [Sunxiuqinia dokdonensis]|uniref:LamG-like jellyroll fold domain-containing protein n=1 Tax=Sunxiuqinia dokdonensis TaxID=1409788 RepID=A0A0L8V6K7_9BACT|nr:LamG domain-containing protein [Sunxiuqinia dokdonensis]KOH43827.1 hypothetical protein NC99_33230 [Sunxiuqinia dokdonensis]
MKIFKQIILIVLAVFFITACNDGIDPITRIEPGPDEAAPVVTLISPSGDVNAPTDVSEVDIRFEATDDIELKTVSVQLNGTSLGSYDSFNDYRRFIGEYSEELALGDHVLEIVVTDMAGKSTTKTVNFKKVNTIRDLMNEAAFHLAFNGDYVDEVSATAATVVGTPSLGTAGVDGGCYVGAADSYLTFDATGLQSAEFSASFFLNITATQATDRAGILVMSPENPNFDDSRKFGFRFFRENGGGLQQFKLNAGNGTAEKWFDGGVAARVNPATTEWVHFVFTVSSTGAKVYIDGVVVKEDTFDGIDWTGCNLLSIMSGAPRFANWNHLSDESKMDELLIYDRVLTQAEIDLLGLLNN